MNGKAMQEEASMTLKRNFRSAEYCGQCHPKEYRQWQTSKHSQSLLNDKFQDLFRSATKDIGTRAKQICLICHAPAAVYNNDLSFTDSRNSRPVNCEICHSITGIDKSGNLIFASGELMDSNNTADMGEGHRVVKNSNFSSSDSCKPCHTHKSNEHKYLYCSQDIGYDKWKEITGRLDTCQDCHMKDSFGEIDHSFPGNSDADILAGSLNTRWSFTSGYSGYKVRVIIHNSEAGHKIPAGMNLRKVLIKITLLNSEDVELYTQDAQLGRVFEDREGIWPVMSWKADELRFDTSINPLEKRMIMFNVPKHARARKVKVEVLYSHFPGDENPIIMYSDTRDI